MIKIVFVCHGNICRSPAAEYVFKQLVKARKLDNKYSCYSLALTNDEIGYDGIGNDIYPPMKLALDKRGIKYDKHHATLISDKDVSEVDYLIYMDDENRMMLGDMYGKNKKFYCLASFLKQEEISDPWFHRGFDGTLDQIYIAVERFIDWLEQK